MRPKISKMSQEDFNTHKKSLNTTLSVKSVSLQEDSESVWAEIINHKYRFNKRELALNMLDSISVSDFQEHFENVFFSESSKRLDLELTAENHKEEQE